ncbi:ABC-F family ATP-binding cassette domain-containing protein [bacterium]|nr:ABC-F family ATP-binding cassette domain-containing protein [bacterium]
MFSLLYLYSNKMDERLPITGKTFINSHDLTLRSLDGRDNLFFAGEVLVQQGSCTAVTGESGSGKTSLIEVACGLRKPDSGDCHILVGQDVIDYLPQDIEKVRDQNRDVSILDFCVGRTALPSLQHELEEIYLSDGWLENSEATARVEEITRELETLGAYTAESEMLRILDGLRISDIPLTRKLYQLSSGQLQRVLIGATLFNKKAELVVLDEPTAFLDRESTAWLAEYIKNDDKRGYLVATGDELFLTACANRTCGITSTGRVFSADGGYKNFLTKVAEVTSQWRREATNLSRDKERLERTAAKLRPMAKRSKDMMRNVKVMERRAERIGEQLDNHPGQDLLDENDYTRNRFFEAGRRSGDNVVKISGVEKLFETDAGTVHVDLSKLELQVQRGDRLYIYGPNGTGKSTLLRMIAKRDNRENLPDAGEIGFGTNVDIGFYTPGAEEALGDDLLIREMIKDRPGISEKHAAAILAYWGFVGSTPYEVTKEHLSRSQKVKLYMAKLMLDKPNLLILDEPIGDFSNADIDLLVEALEDYTGTLIIVSHDPRLSEREEMGFNIGLRLPEVRVEDYRKS